jgi:hypothetical protein
MSEFELRHLSLGAVLGTIGAVLGFAALIVSLSSSANATSNTLVRKGDIAPGAVTAKALAKGVVHSKALAKGAVNSKALAKGSVTASALAKDAVTNDAMGEDSVTARAIAPGSVYGGALGTETIHTVPITDLDAVAENGTWTASNTETAVCSAGERLLGGSFAFTNPGNREVAFLQALPFTNGAANGVSGRITSNSGGSAAAEIVALCLG